MHTSRPLFQGHIAICLFSKAKHDLPFACSPLYRVYTYITVYKLHPMLPLSVGISSTFAMLPQTVLTWLGLAAPAVTAAELPIRFVTFNIRGGSDNPVEGEELWSVRRPLVGDTLSNAASAADGPTIFGLQEVHPNQLVDVKEALGDGWSHVGVGRDDGKNGGDYSPLLYDSNDLELIFEETKWLSETPDKPSFGWGASNRRTASIAVFEHKKTKQRFIASNTHLDHEIPEARVEGVKLILDWIRAAQKEYGPLSVGFTGDFNSEPDEDAHSELEKIGYVADVFEVSGDKKGPEETFTGFTEEDRKKRIDYIYVGPVGKDKWEVGTYEVVDNLVDGVYSSDHRAVVVDLTLEY